MRKKDIILCVGGLSATQITIKQEMVNGFMSSVILYNIFIVG